MDGFVTVYSVATGRKRRVPKHYLDQPRLMNGLRVPPSQRDALDELPEGNPNDAWKVEQLRTYAGNHGIDLSGATTKAAILAAIAAAPETSEPDQGADETPATGE